MAERTEGGVVDAATLGRRIRAARVLSGYDNMHDLTAAVRELGMQVSDRTIYAIERGEQPASWELMVALVAVMRPPGGDRFFWSAINPPHQALFVALNSETDAEAAAREATQAYLVTRTSVDAEARKKA